MSSKVTEQSGRGKWARLRMEEFLTAMHILMGSRGGNRAGRMLGIVARLVEIMAEVDEALNAEATPPAESHALLTRTIKAIKPRRSPVRTGRKSIK